ncbi:MAG: hypothetical protein IJR90_00790 [Clostridia bacterium]|nr:hypothetical protein [Clostridia bacterium]
MEYTYAEMHFHTSETSKCGEVSAAESIPVFKKNGYDLVCITDHFNERYFSPDCDKKEVWAKEIEEWMAGWYAAREAAEKCGLTVIHGVEIQLKGHFCELLVYGLTEDDFRENIRMFDMTVEELSEMAKRKGLFIAIAHPFRSSDRPDPRFYQGAEIYNRAEETRFTEGFDINHNRQAAEFAEQNGLIPLCGQDFHEWAHFIGFRTRFHGEVRDVKTMIEKLLAREFDLLLPNGVVVPAK